MSRAQGIFSIVLLVICACGTPTRSIEDDQATLDGLRGEIDALVRSPTCIDVNDCRAAPLGVKPCGGPWEYVIYSAMITDSTELANKIDLYDEAQREYNEKHQAISDCMFVAPPTLGCTNNLCASVP